MRVRVFIGIAGVALLALGISSVRTHAFNPQPEPPGFGLVSLVDGQGIRVNVVCSSHSTSRFPPDPCFGSLMLHDMAGNVLASQTVSLRPGQAASLSFNLPLRETGGPVGIDPCWIPASFNQGHAIPSAEVFNSETGRTMLFMNPAVARLSALAVSMSEAPVAGDIR